MIVVVRVIVIDLALAAAEDSNATGVAMALLGPGRGQGCRERDDHSRARRFAMAGERCAGRDATRTVGLNSGPPLTLARYAVPGRRIDRMSREDHEQTRRHFDVVAEALRSEIRQAGKALTASTEALERCRLDISRSSALRTDMADGPAAGVRN